MTTKSGSNSHNSPFERNKVGATDSPEKNYSQDFIKQDNSKPSPFPKSVSVEVVANLQLISEVFQKIENETAEVAEMIFDYLINVPDEEIMMGAIKPHQNKRINEYIKILNRLFIFSRKSKFGSFRVLNRKTVEDLDKKTFAICMCFDGGVSLDVLCSIANETNEHLKPSPSPVEVRAVLAFGQDSSKQR